MNKSKYVITNMSTIRACVLGTVISITLLILMAAISAIFIMNEQIELSAGKYLAWGLQFVASLAGCYLSGRLVKENKAVACGIVAAANLLVQLAVALLIFDGLAYNVLLCLLPIFAAWGCAILLNTKSKSHSGNKRRRAFVL